MARAPKKPNLADPSWTEFAARHAGHPALKHEALYALPLRLIDAIMRRAPGVLSPEDQTFERDLAELAGDGFFLQRPFSYPLLPRNDSEPADEQERELRERQNRSQAQIKELIVADMKHHGRSDTAIDRHFATQKEIQQRIFERSRGYAGWLVTHPEFHRSRADFCRQWRPRIRKERAMPEIPFSFMGERPTVPKRSRPFYSDCTLFYRRWGLERLATWDLPVPMRSELVSPSFYALSSIGDAGLLLFAPWYLLADKSLKLHELAEYYQSYGDLQHLEEWLSGGPRKWGPERFGEMLELYVYLELALRTRYGDRLQRNKTNLDLAFAEYGIEDAEPLSGVENKNDSVRKIRQEMQRRLRCCIQSPWTDE